MGKRAMRTSAKRVQALLRVERAKLVNEVEAAMRASAERNAAFGFMRTVEDSPGDVWLTPRPEREYVSVPLMFPLGPYVSMRHSPATQIREVVFKAVRCQLHFRSSTGQPGVRFNWVNWECVS